MKELTSSPEKALGTSPQGEPTGKTLPEGGKSQAKTPDPTGLAVAQIAQESAGKNTVILFGSRARGNHRPDSDVDLLIVCKNKTHWAESRAKKAIWKYFDENPPWLNVDYIPMDQDNFNYCRRAPNHVAGQAWRDGIIMSGERLDHSSQYEDDYPESWPDVRERLTAAYRNLGSFNHLMENRPEDQELCGFVAQQAVENALKGWISAAGLEYRNIHDINRLGEVIEQDQEERISLAGHQLRMLLEYTSYPDPDGPGEDRNWLNNYAVLYRYSGTRHEMDDQDHSRFHQEINLATHTFINRAFEITGASEEDLRR